MTSTPAVIPEHVSVWAELADVDHVLRHVQVGGVRTRVLQAGAGEELVLLHGTGGHLEAYARDIAGLARDFHVTAYDMVGHGWSDLPDTPYTTDVLSEHLIGLLDALGIERAHLSGESLGGWVVAWTAAFHPDRVDRVVLNTPGNIANKPEVMARMSDSTRAAVQRPERRGRPPARRVPVPPQGAGHRRTGQPAAPGLQPPRVPAGRREHPRAAGPRRAQGLRVGPELGRQGDRADAAAVDRPRSHRRPGRGGHAARLAARRPAARDHRRRALAAVGEGGRVPRRAPHVPPDAGPL